MTEEEIYMLAEREWRILNNDIQYAQNGAKLEGIETSEEKSVIPEGHYHKDKHHLDLDVTKKGIPVVQLPEDVDSNKIETFEDVKEHEDEMVQSAEIERAEIIFSKELTDYIESKRKEWHESEDPEICLEVGKRLVAELMFNTDDNAGVVEKMS